MAVQLIVVGHERRDPLIDAAEAYLQKAARQLKVQVQVLDPARRLRKADDEKIRQVEAEAILARVGKAQLIALDEHGRQLSSVNFAKRLQGWLNRGDLALVIGGATGLAEQVRSRALFTLALSDMTLPHRMARLLICEQIYRATSIWSGSPYHKA